MSDPSDGADAKVTAALAALLTAGMPGVNVFTDRSDEEPIMESERPAIVLRIVDVQFEPEGGQSTMRHRATLDSDFYEQELTFGGISKRLSRMITLFNATIAGDRSLGGRLERFELMSATADPDSVPDLGCATVTSDLSYLTPRDDFSKIIGAAGFF